MRARCPLRPPIPRRFKCAKAAITQLAAKKETPPIIRTRPRRLRRPLSNSWAPIGSAVSIATIPIMTETSMNDGWSFWTFLATAVYAWFAAFQWWEIRQQGKRMMDWLSRTDRAIDAANRGATAAIESAKAASKSAAALDKLERARFSVENRKIQMLDGGKKLRVEFEAINRGRSVATVRRTALELYIVPRLPQPPVFPPWSTQAEDVVQVGEASVLKSSFTLFPPGKFRSTKPEHRSFTSLEESNTWTCSTMFTSGRLCSHMMPTPVLSIRPKTHQATTMSARASPKTNPREVTPAGPASCGGHA